MTRGTLSARAADREPLESPSCPWTPATAPAPDQPAAATPAPESVGLTGRACQRPRRRPAPVDRAAPAPDRRRSSPARSSPSSPAAPCSSPAGRSAARRALTPGTPADEAAGLPAVLGHLPRGHRPLRRRPGRPQGAHRGRDQGDDRRARRPVLAVPHARRVQGEPAGHRRASSRASAPPSARWTPRARTRRCTTLGPDCRLAIVAPIPGSPAEKAGLQPGDVITTIDGDDGRRPDPGPGAREGPRPQGHDGRADDRARRRGAVRRRDRSRAVIIPPEVETKDARRRDGRLHQAGRVLRPRGRRASPGRRRTTSRPARRS